MFTTNRKSQVKYTFCKSGRTKKSDLRFITYPFYSMKHLITLLLSCSFLFGFSQTITPDNPNIQYIGRFDLTTPTAPVFAWPGTTIKVKFKGTNLTLHLDDLALGGATTTNFFTIIIDGDITSILETNKNTSSYLIAENLENEEHVIQIFKRTESSVGSCRFKGFTTDASSLLPLERDERKIEFIGDSWTCGYGNEINSTPSTTNTGFHSENEDNYHAWGAIISKRLGAEYMCTAYSGRGVYRNNTGTTTGVLTSIFNHTIADQASKPWDHSSFHPDVVVIKLGTNDFFKETTEPMVPLDSADFVGAEIDLVQQVRAAHPDATIIVAFGSSKTDWWPSGLQHLTRWRTYSNAVVSHFNNQGDQAVVSFEIDSQKEPYGEDWHPSKATHEQIATDVGQFIKLTMGWSGGTTDCNGVEGGTAFRDDCQRCVEGNTNLSPCSAVSGLFHTEKNAFHIYPNPTTSVVHFEEILNWQLTDLLGNSIQHGRSASCDLSTSPTGSYILTSGSAKVRVQKN